ncbi:MAG: Xaa-Pro dipeptidase [Rhodospirillaceae bacterium]|nr:Xaa-Pro dipeptidase [Rhodospirillaceae bacterium]
MTHFPPETYAFRVAACREDLERRGLSALLVFAQESQYYLFGYDGGGYVFFQCTVLTTVDRPITLLCRRPDVAQARDTSTIGDIRIWLNAEDADPAGQLRDILVEQGLIGSSIGIEMDNYGCTGATFFAVAEAVDGICKLVDASDLVRRQRLLKSEEELVYVRAAASLADSAVAAVGECARPGLLDSKLTAAAMAAMLEGGGDIPPAGPLVNSGRRAVYGRGVGGARVLEKQDQVVIELAATYRRYNACIERTLVIGKLSPKLRSIYALVEDTLLEMLEAFRPGELLGQIDKIHQARLDAAGYKDQRYGACGYSLGATFRPSWMDVPPMIYTGNPTELRPGMVFFPHVMLGDTETGLAMGLGQTLVVTETGSELLTKAPLGLIER